MEDDSFHSSEPPAMADRDPSETPAPVLKATRRMTEQERAAPPGDAPSLDAGQELAGRFRIVRRLGHGGMGEVYEAEDRELGETVALKTVLPSIARDPEALRRFNREIHLARKVTHPNVCRIFDVFHDRVETDGRAEEIAFFTMEMLPGETLEQRLRRQGRMSTLEAGPIVRQIVEGLAAAHQAGVIHRDFKTANVMLVPGRGGLRAVITDFGLARAGAGHEAAGGALTMMGDVLGSPLYMAPEQVTAGEITTATDVYTLGLVIYEMVTGRPPFLGDSVMATMVKRLQEPPPPPRLAVPDLDPDWNDAILRCLEIKPADRFADIRDVAAALGGAEVEPGPTHKRLARRRWLLAVAGLILAVLAAVLWIFWRPGGKAAGARPAVAVLGFRNLLPDQPGTDAINQVLVATLPIELEAGGKLRLIPGETVTRMKLDLDLPETESFAPDTLKKIHRNVGADLVVLGTYLARAGQEVPERLDISVQEAATGEKVASVVDTAGGNINELILRLGERLRRELGVGELSTVQQREVRAALPGEAARLYAEGLARLRVSEALEARRSFEKAVEAEPDYPLAHAGLAKALQKLGYDRKATEEAKLAFSLSGALPLEEKLQVEAQYREIANELDRAIAIYGELADRFPDDLEYGLRLAELQTTAGQGKAALSTIASLRKLPAGEDPRLDLAEAAAAASQSEFERQRQLAEAAETKGRSRGARLLVAQALLEQGKAHVSTSEYQKALDVFEKAQRIYTEVGDDAAVARTLGERGAVLFYRGDKEAALRLHEEALTVFQRLGYRAGEAMQLNRIGSTLDDQGESAQAMAAWERAVEISREIGAEPFAAQLLYNMAGLLIDQGRLAEARQQCDSALAIFRSTGSRSNQEVVLGTLAFVLRSQGELAQARKTLEEALSIAGEIGDRSGVGYLLGELALVLAAQGEADQAWKKHQEALALRVELGEKDSIADSRLAMAGFLVDKGEPGQARPLAEQALARFRAEGQADGEAEARAVLARALAARGDLAKAREEISAAESLTAKSGSSVRRMTVQLAAGQVRAAAGEAAQARRLLTAVRDEARSSGFAGLELEARLELGRLAAKGGDRALLAAVEKDARARGFGRIAREARRLGGL